MKLISKLLILTPFGYLLYNLIKIKEYFDPFYFYGFYGLSVLGILGILFNINYNLSIFYLLISFSVYSFFYDLNIYNLWAVGALFLLIKYPEKSKVEKTVPIVEKAQKSSEKVVESKVEKTVPKEVTKVYTRSEKVKEDIWDKYRDKDKFNKFKKKLIKLIVDPYGIK